MRWLDRLPLGVLAVAGILLGLAPFAPEPHLVEKLRMMVHGELVQPVDLFDLLLHGAPVVLLALKLGRLATPRARATRAPGG